MLGLGAAGEPCTERSRSIGDQGGLAGAGLAHDEADLDVAGKGVLKKRLELGQLALACNEYLLEHGDHL
ncbi:MAG: hypothetical protein ACE5LU_05640 [Anaerolineae bacterium]